MRRHLPRGFSAVLPLGEGGQARTWLCWQETPGRWVVLKTDPKDRGELGAEAELLERLPGAPVPALLARDLAAKHPWIAMSWIDGVRLDSLPPDLDPLARRALLSAAARSVAGLHGRGVVHGDLAAANILALPGAVEVVVVDLGMASIGGSRSGGTWETISAERLEGRPASPASDVFSLGVLALRLLDRIPSEWTASREVWTESVRSDALRSLATDLPAVARAVAADPSTRPGAAELAAALDPGTDAWPRERLFRKAREDFDALLEHGIRRAAHQKAWSDAWRFQRERIERSDDPEPLLPELGRFARERDARERATRRHPLIALAAVAALCLASFALLRGCAPRIAAKPVSTAAPDPSFVDFSFAPVAPIESFPLPSVPPGASLRVDGLPTDMPEDGLLLLATGRHRIQLRDAVGTLLLDTLWLAIPQRPAHAQTRAEHPR